jgi:hypothetical protein
VEELETRLVPAGTWTAVNPAPSGLGTMMLLSDGSVMAQQAGVTNVWYKLTPSSTGDYASGTWTTLAPMSLQRQAFASNMLKDGRVFLVGGEYSGSPVQFNRINTGEIYDPVSNTWSAITNFPNDQFGDDPSILLDSGLVLCGYIGDTYQTYLYYPITNTWTLANYKVHADLSSDEETWLKLPDGSVLSYDVWSDAGDFHLSAAQRYVPSTNTWVDAGTVPVDLSSATQGGKFSFEIGGATMLPDGRAWFVGATGHTAFYTPSTNSWVAGPDLPNGQHADDAPLCSMTNGHVLVAADGSSSSSPYSPPTHIYDYNPLTNMFTETEPPPFQGNTSLAAEDFRMLALPDGRVALSSGFASNQLYLYTPDSGANPAWAPTISGITTGLVGGTFTLTGTQLNGITAGASFGDDAEMDSNYPIVEFLDHGGSYHFARTFNWTSTDVQTGSTLVATNFTLPPGVTNGAYRVQVVTNGIASRPVLDVLMDSSLNNLTLKIDSGNSSLYDVYNGSTLLSQWAISSFSAVIVTMKVPGGTVNIQSTPSGVPVKVYGGGFAGGVLSTINIGSGGSVQGIQGPIDLENPSNYNTITIDDSADTSARTVTLKTVTNRTVLDGDTAAAGQLSGLAPAPITWEYYDTSSVTINGGTGSNTWNIQGNDGSTTINAHGSDTFNLGNAHNVQGIHGTLTLANPPNFNAINLDDVADFLPRSVTLAATAGVGSITGLAPGTIRYRYSDTRSLSLFLAVGGNVVNVQATDASALTTLIDAATVNVGNAGSVQGVAGTLNLEDLAGFTTVNVGDSADTVARTVVLGTFTPPGDTPWGSITGLPSASINYRYADTNALTLSLGGGANTVYVNSTGGRGATTVKTGSGANSIYVRGTTGQLNLDGGSGFQNVYIGPADLLSGIHGAVDVYNGNLSGSSALTVDDSSDLTPRTVTLGAGVITGLTPAGISWAPNLAGTSSGGVDSLSIFGGSGGNTYTVTNTSPFYYGTFLETGAGNDTVNVLATTGALYDYNTGGQDYTFVGTTGAAIDTGTGTTANINGLVQVSGPGPTVLVVDDSGDPSSRTVTLNSTGLTGLGNAGVISFSANLGALLVGGGSGGNTFNVSDFGAGLQTIFSTGNGNAAVNVTVDASSGYQLTFNGGTGTNSLFINDPTRAATFNPNPAPQNTGTVNANYLSPGLTSIFSYSNMGTVTTKPDANHSFVQALFHDVYGYSGNQAQLNAWVAQLPLLGQAGVAAAINHTQDAYTHVVDGWFGQFLQETPSPDELAQYTGELAQGETQEQVLSEILATKRFLELAESSTGEHGARAFVEALYAALLGIPASQIPEADLHQWIHKVHREGRQQVVLAFLTGSAYRTLQIEADYQRLLHRAATAGEVTDWLSSGLNLLAIQIGIESLPEFYTSGG